MSILKEAEDKIRELIDDLLGRHSHGPDVIERHAAELKQVANSLAAAQMPDPGPETPANEQPAPPTLDAVEEGAEPNSTADDAAAVAEDVALAGGEEVVEAAETRPDE